MGLREAIAQLPVAAERRDGYTRDKFRHWVDEDRDGCNTRNEVLLDEATWTPEIGPGCRLSGGRWSSYYDDVDVDEAARLDIDHMVPLAEAWDSGAYTWDAGRRQRYANDLGDPRALAAVTARANRSKADQDPADWLPPYPPARCRYLGEWVAVKHRWRLSADPAEKDTLTELGRSCRNDLILIIPAL
ncbi:HNH endonuclease family protein [Actinomadura sp. NPDC047616]|uniref:HNH endonuclease family protein n=1 Tax=Actinomadura sp. NPDC047616 TaxID=3155914 RepID=UPI0034087E93